MGRKGKCILWSLEWDILSDSLESRTNHLTGPAGVSWDVLGGILSARRTGRLRVVLSFLYITLPLFRVSGGCPGRLALERLSLDDWP